MKWIKYKFPSCEVNYGTEENPDIKQTFIEKSMTYSESNEEIAKKEAYNGEYTIEDDGAEEIPAEPSQLDRVESQVAYLAMMTGYTDILEV